jgi:pyridoxine/pyridoxamine 5'-phosphate oxidase
MTLATVGADGRPSTRVVLIKGVDARGIAWYTNFHSRKGQELAGNPMAALQFHWVELERVVRIEGRVSGSATPRPTRTTRRGRWIHASAPGRRRRAR